MPTLGADVPHEPHMSRHIAESFGSDPARYDRSRPTYPPAVVARVLDAAPGGRVLDVGCGTGIEARQLRDEGCDVLGVEPDARMAERARATGIAVEVATFEAWDAGGRAFDAVVSGTAWHWVDPVAGAAKASEVLSPGGVLIPFGSVYQLPDAVAAGLAEALARLAPQLPFRSDAGSLLDAYGGLYERAAQGIRAAGGFDDPVVWREDWHRTYTADELVDLVATSGGLTSMPEGQAAEVLAAVRATLDDGAAVIVPYATWGVTARRRSR